jgi:hypothetical protein
MNIRKWWLPLFSLLLIFIISPACSPSSSSIQYSNARSAERAGAKKLSPEQTKELVQFGGQKIFVPAYSHIYHQEREIFDITTTVSIHNTDGDSPIVIMEVKYYNTPGQLVRNYIDSPLLLPPMATLDYVVPEKDRVGGSGANFIVTWQADNPVSKPLVETVMIDGRYGISFSSRGVAIE